MYHSPGYKLPVYCSMIIYVKFDSIRFANYKKILKNISQ